MKMESFCWLMPGIAIDFHKYLVVTIVSHPVKSPLVGRRQNATHSAAAVPRAMPTTTSPQWCTLSEILVQQETQARETTSNCVREGFFKYVMLLK